MIIPPLVNSIIKKRIQALQYERISKDNGKDNEKQYVSLLYVKTITEKMQQIHFVYKIKSGIKCNQEIPKAKKLYTEKNNLLYEQIFFEQHLHVLTHLQIVLGQ